MSNQEATTTELDYSKIGVSEERLKKMSERPRLPDGKIARFLIQHPAARVQANEKSVLSMQAVPLRDPQNQNSTMGRLGVYFAVDLPTTDMDDDTLEKTLKKARNWLAAIGNDVGPTVPSYSKETRKFTLNGAEVSASIYEELKTEKSAAVCAELIRLAKNPKELENLAFYATVAHVGERTYINNPKHKMPEGEYFTKSDEEIRF